MPFNSLNEDVEMDLGLEGGVELRFYQRPNSKAKLDAEGFYMGIAMDGGYSKFRVNDRYLKNDFSISGDLEKYQFNQYDRVRTSISFIVGGQAKLGDKLYFDENIGTGWNNVNVKTTSNETEITNYTRDTPSLNPFFLHFEEGKGQRFYMPLSVSIGYNFGNK